MTAPQPQPLPDELLTPRDVARRLKVSRRTLRRWVAIGKFPPPVRCSATCVRWSARAVEDYLQRLTAAGAPAKPPAAESRKS